MDNTKSRKPWFAALAAAGLCTLALHAGERTWDFETDPFEDFDFIQSTQEDLVWGGQGFDDWGAEGNPGGFFSISEATGSTSTLAVLPDIDGGKLVKAFTMTMDLRMGNGTTDRPADGISINFARAGDPILDDPSPTHAAASGAAETGTTTGVAISFDTWAGNALPDGPDIEGVIVRVDNKTVTRVAMPVRHGDPDDIESLQTGPQGDGVDTERGDPTILSWRPLEVSIDEVGLLDVKYKGQFLLENFESGFFPSAGQIVLMGRTGGANEAHHIDNLKLTTVLADAFLLSGLNATPTGFSMQFTDLGTSKLDPASLALTLDGEAITADDVSKNGDITTITYDSGSFFESGSSHEVGVSAKATTGDVVEKTVSFTAGSFTTIPASAALSGVSTSTKGFLMRVIQADVGVGAGDAAREDHLAGRLLDANGDPLEDVIDDFGSDNGVWTLDLINFDQDGAAQGVFRDLGDGSARDVFDDFIPGVPGLTGSTDNITAEILTVVRIPEAGIYKFGFNSDDGFKTTAGNIDDVQDAILLGIFNGGRGAATTEYSVLFEEAGDYQLRSIWYEGGGGANLEWFTISPNEALLNDTANGGLQTYAVRAAGPLALTSLSPVNGQSEVSVRPTISATFLNAGTSLDAGSVKLSVDGAEVSASVQKSGDVSTVSYTPTEDLDGGSSVSATLSWADSAGNERSASTTFTTTVLIPGALFIEAEDFDFGHGQWIKNEGIGMTGPYAGGAYQDLGDGLDETDVDAGTDYGIDYFETASGSAQAVYRPDTGVEAGKTNANGLSRGSFDVETNHLVGWNDAGDWFNYTRVFPEPAQDYNAYIRASSGGDPIHGSLSIVTSGVGTTDQTLEVIGEVRPGRATAGWDSYEIFPILEPGTEAGASGPLAVLTLGGQVTLRHSVLPGHQDFDFYVFVPAKAPVVAGGITSVSLSGGSVAIEYTGTLKSSDSVSGPYAPVAGASSPYSASASKGAEFFIAE